MNTQNNTTTTTSKSDYFSQLWEKSPLVHYDPKWSNGTGYLDYAVNKPVVNEDQPLVAFMDNLNRKGLIVYHGMVDGKVRSSVIFQRYTNGDNDVYVSNRSDSIKTLIPNCDTSLSQQKMMRIVSAKVEDLDNPVKLKEVAKWMLEDHLEEGYYYLESAIEKMADWLGVPSRTAHRLCKKIKLYHRASREFPDSFDSGKAFDELQREIAEL